MNGVMQFSVLDGWWVEGYKENGGWALPMERTFTDQGFQDELDAEMIYTTIEEQIRVLLAYTNHSWSTSCTAAFWPAFFFNILNSTTNTTNSRMATTRAAR